MKGIARYVIGGVVLGLVPAEVFGIRELVAVAARTFVAGGMMGTVFALSVARRERGHGLAELSYSRFGASGLLGGSALGIALVLATPGILPLGVAVAGAIGFGLVGAGFSIATLAFARRAEGLPVGRRLESATHPQLPPVI